MFFFLCAFGLSIENRKGFGIKYLTNTCLGMVTNINSEASKYSRLKLRGLKKYYVYMSVLLFHL